MRWRPLLRLALGLALLLLFARFLLRAFLVLFVVLLIAGPILRWYLRRKFAARPPPAAPPGKVIDADYEIR